MESAPGTVKKPLKAERHLVSAGGETEGIGRFAAVNTCFFENNML